MPNAIRRHSRVQLCATIASPFASVKKVWYVVEHESENIPSAEDLVADCAVGLRGDRVPVHAENRLEQPHRQLHLRSGRRGAWPAGSFHAVVGRKAGGGLDQ